MIGAQQMGPSADGTCGFIGPKNAFSFLFLIPLLLYYSLGLVALVYTAIRTRSQFQTDRLRYKILSDSIFVIIFFIHILTISYSPNFYK